VISETGNVACAEGWRKLIHALSATSPACGFLHPSETTSKLVKEMFAGDITTNPHLMKCLQEELPVVFELARTLHGYPHELMKPIMEELVMKASAPFQNVEDDKTVPLTTDEMSYFPHLPKCRERRVYAADTAGKLLACTKRSSRHPTLLPGVFTLFCEHGEYLTLQMRFAEHYELL
jgi:hypothetical protein